MHFASKISTKPFRGLSQKTFPVLVVTVLLASQEISAQITEDFSDGNFTSNPEWSGTTHLFVVNSSGQLQLQAPEAGTAWLSTAIPSTQTNGLEWEFMIRQSFAGSASNFSRVYLASDQANLANPLNGYFLQFGEAGANDAVELFRQTGTSVVSVCRATQSGISSAFTIRVKVRRDQLGVWQLSIDYNGGADFTTEATGEDLMHGSFRYFGIHCVYTISNAARFYFDGIAIKGVSVPDSVAPVIVSAEAISRHELILKFSEALGTSAQNAANYYLPASEAHPANVLLHDDKRTVTLAFNEPFPNGEETVLNVNDIADLSGNTLTAAEAIFVYFEEVPTVFRDIVISEILADPIPAVGLPDEEFIEILNRSSHPVNTNEWILRDESGSAVLGPLLLLPDQYAIITSTDGAEAFGAYNNVLALQDFPSLNNAGDLIILQDNRGVIIDSIRYDKSWYRDDEKAGGGWSLELIDPNKPCSDQNNWVAAESHEGGTPGQRNSVDAQNPDNRGPEIVAVIPTDSVTIVVKFNETLDKQLPSHAAFALEPGIAVASVSFADATLTGISVALSEPLSTGTLYTLTLGDIYDCPGNRIDENNRVATFLLPDTAAPGDIVINEVLFNPRSTGVDFVEIYNRSNKAVDLQNWSLRNSMSAAGMKAAQITANNLLILPERYLVFTEDGDVLKGEYVKGDRATFFDTTLPPLNDGEGSVVLLDAAGVIIDSMMYSDEMHSAFVKDSEGISLERISFDWEAAQNPNWRSASAATGFATPGYMNSNVRNERAMEDGAVTIEPEIIQSNVANLDFAQIKYRLHSSGFIGNIKIYDHQGRTIRAIADNELLGTEGFFRWEGERDNGTRVGKGYYMVWFEIFDLSGTVRTYRKRIAVF